MTPTTYGRDFAYCLKSHGGVRGFYASLWRFLLRCTLFCHSVATFLTSVSSYEGGCGFEVLYTEIYEKWTNELKRRFSRSIRKHMYFLSSPDLKYLTDTDIKQGATGGVFIYPFSLRGGYMILMGKVNYFQTRQKQKKYQIVDYAKGLIEKYNKVGIKDLDGNVYY